MEGKVRRFGQTLSWCEQSHDGPQTQARGKSCDGQSCESGTATTAGSRLAPGGQSALCNPLAGNPERKVVARTSIATACPNPSQGKEAASQVSEWHRIHGSDQGGL